MLYYLFGITGAETPMFLSSPVVVERITCSGLSALVERVPASDFAPEVLEERLTCLEWVAGAARRHEAVLELAMARGAVIPARLCTLFDSEVSVARSLELGKYRFSATLDFLAGRAEWGVKVFCDEGALDDAIANEDPEMLALAKDQGGKSPGLAYLLQKKREARRAALREDHIDSVISMVQDEVSARAVTFRDNPPLAAEITGRTAPMVLNMAVLSSKGEWAEIEEALEELARDVESRGFLVETSGPWPPYSFTGEEVRPPRRASSIPPHHAVALGGVP